MWILSLCTSEPYFWELHKVSLPEEGHSVITRLLNTVDFLGLFLSWNSHFQLRVLNTHQPVGHRLGLD